MTADFTDYRLLGRTGVRVSPFALGTMNFGAFGKVSAEAGQQLVQQAFEAGINLIDTADVYSKTESEVIVGQALAKAAIREDVVLATKFFSPLGDDPNRRGSSRRWIFRAVEDSLRRLGTDYIDIYQAHRPDEATELEETIDALADLVRAGKIRYYGTSTFPASQVVEAQWLGRARGTRPATEQPPYSILARGIETELLPVAQQHGLGVLVWSPLAGGWLSGRYRQHAAEGAWPRWANALRHDPEYEANKAKAAAVEALGAVAAEAGLTLLQLALAFAIEHPAVTTAILGPRTPEQLAEQLTARQVRLTPDVLDAIDTVVAPGVTLSPGDLGYIPPAITEPQRRRRTASR